MRAYLFPGQGTQFPGMGKELNEKFKLAQELFSRANEILGYSISDIMFHGSAEDLKETKYSQPAIFLYSYIQVKMLGKEFNPDMVAGHSLGEITALAVSECLDFESALNLIAKRASAMQKVCENENTGMAVVVGLYDVIVQDICKKIDGIVVPANYNALNQVVISGEKKALKAACDKLRPGAKGVINLSVSGAFHYPFMEPIVDEFRVAIEDTVFKKPICPVYQNVTARPSFEIEKIKQNLIDQLTHPVMWRHTILHMIEDGANEFIEIGPGNFLRRLVKQINSSVRIGAVPL